ncbi:hypothetical protein PUNSTDRAFT_146996 [Punctularia strigosozonata HHB-11173 SS5]|uniref:Zn(2)-C6 fungal-type domain-containing protein n=1 Tax=Punctularia strigosozonata (strain HHB-11173) TaxID=741275 RepID=R7RZZ5_PUNST|nr:uncharacterized protein PUNSTDRAFT_146996 [Punctularia strigosozonata HHB-11173 SS5]EIN03558.1 hypothetical protein PUNSTDRAFT_146996 [Punctularia strigosozonata HHB-11173 SS5]
MESEAGEPGGVKRNQKRKRSQQVCTSCRQSKLRCDFLDTFPEPCTRCANAKNSTPCIVDPSFRRTTTRKKPGPVNGSASTSGAAQRNGHREKESTPLADITLGEENIDSYAPWHDDSPSPSEASYSPGPCLPKTLGDVTLDSEEIQACFDAFFSHYHPFFSVILEPIEPQACFDRCSLLFWAICITACRPRPDNPVLRARNPEFSLKLGVHVRRFFSELLVAPIRSIYAIQALLITSEYIFVAHCDGREDLHWIYSGLAVQMGLKLGLHRPDNTTDFRSRAILDKDRMHERILVWVQCFIVHQSIASTLGLPSCLSEDWVTFTFSHARDECWHWVSAVDPDLPKLLRIQRFALRMSGVMGNNVKNPSGENDPLVAPALISILNRELLDIETSLSPMSPIVCVRFLEAKLSLYSYCLQDTPSTIAAYAQDIVSCYTSAVRMVDILQTLTKNEDTRPVFWPQSLCMSMAAATICLLRLAIMQSAFPNLIPVNRSVILREVSIAYEIIKMQCNIRGDASDRAAQIIQILAKKVAGTLPGENEDDDIPVRSRMGLGNLLYRAINQLRRTGQSRRTTVQGATQHGAKPVNGDVVLDSSGHHAVEGDHESGGATDGCETAAATFELSDWLEGLSRTDIDDMMSLPLMGGSGFITDTVYDVMGNASA